MKQTTKRTIPFTSRINEQVLDDAIKKYGKASLRTKIAKYITKISK